MRLLRGIAPGVLILILQPQLLAIFVNYHITHHAGTSMFMLARSAKLAWDGTNGIFNIVTDDPQRQYELWTSNVTSHKKGWNERPDDPSIVLPQIREYVAVEQRLTEKAWSGFPLDYPDVHSVFIMRHPIDRLLSADAGMQKGIGPGKYDEWFRHVSTRQYSLRWLVGLSSHEAVNNSHLEIALHRIKQFEHIAIQEAMPDTLQFMCDEWGWSVCKPPGHMRFASTTLPERIGNDLLLQQKLEEHILDFQLYDACVQIARDQNKNRSTPALDAIPGNSFVYEMYLVQEHMGLNISENGGKRALSSAYISADQLEVAALSFDRKRSAEYERNRRLAELYDGAGIFL